MKIGRFSACRKSEDFRANHISEKITNQGSESIIMLIPSLGLLRRWFKGL